MRGLTILSFLMVVAWVMGTAYGGEVTGAGAIKLLRQHKYNVKGLKQSGHKILFGELTGAGKTMNLDRVKLIMTKKKVFDLNQANHIQFKHPSAAKSLIDVQHLEFGNQMVKESQIEALVVK